MRKATRIFFRTLVYTFAIIGFVLTAGFFAVKFNLTKVEGAVDANNSEYQTLRAKIASNKKSSDGQDLLQKEIEERKLLCQIDVAADYAPANAEKILDSYLASYNKTIAMEMMLALQIRIGVPASQQAFDGCQNKQKYEVASISKIRNKISSSKIKTNVFPWINFEEWPIVMAGIKKDKDKIITASQSADIDPRQLVSACIVEQLRLYHTDREKFEKIFKPLEILGNFNQMAWGVMAIKEQTAITIEKNLKDAASDYYPGIKFEKLLDFKTDNPTKERYDRLTDDKNHIYAYLYGALYLKEYQAQWQAAGYPIDDRPEIVSTLFNLGFEHSVPKADPEVGGSIINIGEASYTFGSLAYEFYYSGEMSDDFAVLK